MVHHAYLTSMGEDYLLRIMRFVLNLQLLRRFNMRNEVHPQSPSLEHESSPHIQDPSLKGIVGVILHTLRAPYLFREWGRNFTPWQTNNKGSKIRKSKHGRICQWNSIEEEIFLCPPLKVEEATSFQEVVDSPNRKEWMDNTRDEMDSIIRNWV